jgi:exosome complex component RRP40
MATPLVLLPSDEVPRDHLPTNNSNPLRLGPGLRILSQTSLKATGSNHVLTATQAGLLTTDAKRNTVSLLSFPNRRYVPTVNDLVIAQIHHSSIDFFHCVVTPNTAHSLLGQLSFEGATKKTRPMLKQGELVYARVQSVGVGAGAEVELTCVNPATGKADGGLGPLVGGMVFDVSTGMAARLIRASSSSAENTDAIEGLVVLSELGKKLESLGGFELAVGRNGKVWVDCSSAAESAVKVTIAIGRCLQETDQQNLHTHDQKKLVTKILRDMKLVS